MTDLEVKNIDKDLMVLDDIIGDCNIKSRDWNSIITLYNVNNKPFPIPALICSKIIERIKEGEIPKMVFREYGINYSAFNNRYNKSKTIIEELSVKSSLSDAEWQVINVCKNDPAFILGQDVERAVAFHFNRSVKKLEKISTSAQAYTEFIKIVHADEFTQKTENNNVQVTIKLGQGLIESI